MRAKKIITSILATTLLISNLALTVRADEENSGAEDFIERLYETCLDREADEAGKYYWLNGLDSLTQSGVTLAYNFVFSPEFQNKKMSNSDYVEHMYQMLMGREAEEEGKAYWVNELNNGASRENLFYGFVRSPEYDSICKSYGIETSTWRVGDNYTQKQFIDCFVQRLYVTCLTRNSEIAGLCYWSDALYDHKTTGNKCAKDFFLSKEYVDKGKEDEDFVKDLYVALMDREADEEGLKYWVNSLRTNLGRTDVIESFANSPEFTKICQDYGILNNGTGLVPSVVVTPIPTPTPEEKHSKEEWMKILGISEYKSTDGVTVYGKFNDTTFFNEEVNEYRKFLGLEPFVIVDTPYEANKSSVTNWDYFKWYGTIEQAAIDCYSEDAPYFHRCSNWTTGSVTIIDDNGHTRAFNSLYSSKGHRTVWEWNTDGIARPCYLVMRSACFEAWLYDNSDEMFHRLGISTVQDVEYVYY